MVEKSDYDISGDVVMSCLRKGKKLKIKKLGDTLEVSCVKNGGK